MLEPKSSAPHLMPLITKVFMAVAVTPSLPNSLEVLRFRHTQNCSELLSIWFCLLLFHELMFNVLFFQAETETALNSCSRSRSHDAAAATSAFFAAASRRLPDRSARTNEHY